MTKIVSGPIGKNRNVQHSAIGNQRNLNLCELQTLCFGAEPYLRRRWDLDYLEVHDTPCRVDSGRSMNRSQVFGLFARSLGIHMCKQIYLCAS